MEVNKLKEENALIGYTGFVGSNIFESFKYFELYNSKNISSITNKKYKYVVCAGISSIKWKANKEPKEDFKLITYLIDILKTVEFQNLILISTISVYENPVDNAYGRNRLYIETYFRGTFNNTYIRFPDWRLACKLKRT